MDRDPMAYAFNGHTFGQFIGDAERLLASAREQERELTSLASLLESDGATLHGPGTNVGVATMQVPAAIELGVASALVDAVARLRRAAGEQRQFVETMLTRLLGDHSTDVACTRAPASSHRGRLGHEPRDDVRHPRGCRIRGAHRDERTGRRDRRALRPPVGHPDGPDDARAQWAGGRAFDSRERGDAGPESDCLHGQAGSLRWRLSRNCSST